MTAGDCKPLLDISNKDIYRKNSFRVTGLSVDASLRDVSKHLDKIRMLAELGQSDGRHGGALALLSAATPDEMREAADRLKDPIKRFVDEFFWVWPEEHGKSTEDPALTALSNKDLNRAMQLWREKEPDPITGFVGTHNLAVVYHLLALDWEVYSLSSAVSEEQRTKITVYWEKAFKRWESLFENDKFWSFQANRIRELDDPRLTTGFSRRMRDCFPRGLDLINADLALTLAENGNMKLASFHVDLMKKSHQGNDDVESTLESVLQPHVQRIREHITQARAQADANPSGAADAARLIISQLAKLKNIFDLFVGPRHELKQDVYDLACTACNQIQIIYHNETRDNATCLAILNEVLPLAISAEVKNQISSNISVLNHNIEIAKYDTIYALITKINESSDAPSLKLYNFRQRVTPELKRALSGRDKAGDAFDELYEAAAYVLRSISVDAWNKQQDKKTALEAIALALEYARKEETKAKLAEDNRTLVSLSTQPPPPPHITAPRSNYPAPGSSQGDPLKKLKIAGLVILGFIVLANLDKCGTSGKSTSGSSTRQSNYSSSQQTNKDTYRVPQSRSAELARDKSAIESQKSYVTSLQNQLDALSRQIDSKRSYLDNTNQYEVDDFNRLVNRYNSELETVRSQGRALNSMIDNYNAKLQRYGY